MAEQKRKGFHALEVRIHELEEEDAKREQAARAKEEEAKRVAPAPGAEAPSRTRR